MMALRAEVGWVVLYDGVLTNRTIWPDAHTASLFLDLPRVRQALETLDVKHAEVVPLTRPR